jgi:hypothetical protein
VVLSPLSWHWLSVLKWLGSLLITWPLSRVSGRLSVPGMQSAPSLPLLLSLPLPSVGALSDSPLSVSTLLATLQAFLQAPLIKDTPLPCQARALVLVIYTVHVPLPGALGIVIMSHSFVRLFD